MRGRKRILDFAGLVGLPCAGMLLLFYMTPWGVGITPDSAEYVGAARNLLAGHGLSMLEVNGTFEPVTHYAPLYPMLLAGIGSLAAEPLQAARWLNLLLFSLNIALFVSLLMRFTKEIWLPLAGGFMLLASYPVLFVHAYAWSEGLFILLMLISLALLYQALVTGQRKFLIAAALSCATASLTRYAGIPLIMSGAAAILLLRRPRSRSLVSSATFTLLSAAPLAVWFIRNSFVAGTATNRSLALHPVSRTHAIQFTNTVSGWLFLPQSMPGLVRAGLIALIPLILVTSIWVVRNTERVVPISQSQEDSGRQRFAVVLLLLFIMTYLATILLSISFVDANTPLDDRILSPVYVCALLLALIGIDAISVRSVRPRLPRLAKGLVALIAAALFILHLSSSLQWARRHHVLGLGFASPSWQQSETLKKVNELPPGIIIYSNAPDAISVLTSRPAWRLPSKRNAMTNSTNNTYEESLQDVQRQLEERRAVIVYFDQLQHRPVVTATELEATIGLGLLHDTEDGAIYVHE